MKKIMSNEVPLVSISCITYNHAPYIRQCLEGFLMQKTNFKFEVLIHDDASTDGTEEIIREYMSRYPDIIKPIYEEENQWVKGRRGSLTFNYPRAKGKYIALCEGDDYWTDPLKLQKQVEFLEAHPEYGLIHTKYYIKNEIKNTFLPHELTNYKKAENDNENYIYTADMRTLTVMFRLTFIESINKVYEYLHNNSIFTPFDDRVSFLTITAQTSIKYIDDITGVYRIYNNESATRGKDPIQKYQSNRNNMKATYALMNYLSLNYPNYKRKCKKVIIKDSIVISLLKTPFFNKLYKCIYNIIKNKDTSGSGLY